MADFGTRARSHHIVEPCCIRTCARRADDLHTAVAPIGSSTIRPLGVNT
ncbi:Uncharacterised protein [Vibrio cholerae]|nr:Uncharacterised protein [Vibrio cholerae]